MARVIEMVRHYGLDDDPLIRQELADLLINLRVASYTNQRAMDKIKSRPAARAGDVDRQAVAHQQHEAAGGVRGHVLGAKITADSGEWGTYAWGQFLLGVPGMRIAGGTDEVMSNIVGERVLGLPKDAGIDSTTPFRDLKVGTQKPAQ